MTDPTPIVLSSPMRLIVPLGTLVLLAAMFAPVLYFADWTNGDPEKLGLGATILSLVGVWLASSAWNAPFAMTINNEGISVRRLLREKHHEFARVKKWWFAVPDGKPTQVAPATNGVIYITLKDRTRLRAEIKPDEAARLASLLPSQ